MPIRALGSRTFERTYSRSARFEPVSSGPTLPPVPNRVWHCWQVFAKTARPSSSRGLSGGRAVSSVRYAAISFALSRRSRGPCPRPCRSRRRSRRPCGCGAAGRCRPRGPSRRLAPASTAASKALASRAERPGVFRASRRSSGVSVGVGSTIDSARSSGRRTPPGPGSPRPRRIGVVEQARRSVGQLRVAGLQQGGQGVPALGRRSSAVRSGAVRSVGQGRRVAERDASAVACDRSRGVAARRPASAKTFGQAAGMATCRRPLSDSLSPSRIVSRGRVAPTSPIASTSSRDRLGVPMRRDPPDHERQEVRAASTCSGQLERPAGVGGGQRLGGVPDHQRQVLVVRVLGVGRRALPGSPSALRAASRWRAEARYSRTTGDGSDFASSANCSSDGRRTASPSSVASWMVQARDVRVASLGEPRSALLARRGPTAWTCSAQRGRTRASRPATECLSSGARRRQLDRRVASWSAAVASAEDSAGVPDEPVVLGQAGSTDSVVEFAWRFVRLESPRGAMATGSVADLEDPAVGAVVDARPRCGGTGSCRTSRSCTSGRPGRA